MLELVLLRLGLGKESRLKVKAQVLLEEGLRLLEQGLLGEGRKGEGLLGLGPMLVMQLVGWSVVWLRLVALWVG